ncbi:MAG: transposase [Bacteroidia bacterium]|nr:transposase [Bacteroidia bacterium]
MEDELIRLYYAICDLYEAELQGEVQRFNTNGLRGAITDEELMTIYIFCMLYEKRWSLKSMHSFIRRYWISWFLGLPSYQTFNSRLNRLADAFAALCPVLMRAFSPECAADAVLLGDSLPVMTCSARRRGQVAPELADKGYCASKGLHYYGVKLHALALRREGALPLPLFAAITPASVHDLTAMRPVIEAARPAALVLDKAYADRTLAQDLRQRGTALITPVKLTCAMPLPLRHFDAAHRDLFNTAVSRLRQPIEACFQWLIAHTNIQNASKVRSAKGLILHMWGRVAVACFLLIFP